MKPSHITRFGRPLQVAALVLMPGMSGVEAQQLTVQQVRQTLVLGGLDVPEWQAFSWEPSLHLDRSGRLYLRPPGEARVTIVDTEGRFVRHVGRRGEGPGEFQRVAGMGLLGDTLWLRNWPVPRISIFDTNGEHLRTERTPVEYAESFPSPQGVTALLRGGYAFATPDGDVLGSLERMRVPVMIGPHPLTQRDTVTLLSVPPGMLVEQVGFFAYRPFPIAPLYSLIPEGAGVVTVDWGRDSSGEVLVRRYDHRGTLMDLHTLTLPMIQVPRRLRDEIIDAGVDLARPPYDAARRRGDPVPRNLRAAVIRGLYTPEYFPPVQDVFVTGTGDVWLRQMSALDTGDWIIIDRSGRIVTEVHPPDGVRFQVAQGQIVWGTWTDELGVPYVARYVVEEPTRGDARSPFSRHPERRAGSDLSSGPHPLRHRAGGG